MYLTYNALSCSLKLLINEFHKIQKYNSNAKQKSKFLVLSQKEKYETNCIVVIVQLPVHICTITTAQLVLYFSFCDKTRNLDAALSTIE